MQFDYFYGSQAEQFSFYRIPKVLFTDPQFKPLSTDAKVLYGILLDRMWECSDSIVFVQQIRLTSQKIKNRSKFECWQIIVTESFLERQNFFFIYMVLLQDSLEKSPAFHITLI